MANMKKGPALKAKPNVGHIGKGASKPGHMKKGSRKMKGDAY